jgi:hypothetical protein
MGIRVTAGIAPDELEIPTGRSGGLGVVGHEDTDEADGENGDHEPVAAGRSTHL